MKITDEAFRKVAEEVLKDYRLVDYKIEGLTVIPTFLSNSKKHTWDALIKFNRNGTIKHVSKVYPGAYTPGQIALKIAHKLGTLK